MSRTFTCIYSLLKIPDLTDEGIKNYLACQPRSDYRKVIKIERPINMFAIKVTFKETI